MVPVGGGGGEVFHIVEHLLEPKRSPSVQMCAVPGTQNLPIVLICMCELVEFVILREGRRQS